MVGRNGSLGFLVFCFLISGQFINCQKYDYRPKESKIFQKINANKINTVCKPCYEIQCKPPTTTCYAGLVTDRCGCCKVCGKLENEPCYHASSKTVNGDADVWLGRCGQGLRCQSPNDDLRPQSDAVCVCENDQDYCGTDNKSYTSLCALKEQALRSRKRISIQKAGPCDAPPSITFKPQSLIADKDDEVSLSCEAVGFPIPNIEWIYRRVDGKETILPNDDSKLSINMRGGPEKWQKTAWVQIQKIEKHHEGDYVCVASNTEGSVSWTARITIR